MSDPVFSEYADYYDLLYQDKDYVGEANYIVALIRRFYTEARTILELGSGTGKHAQLLAGQGYTVLGVECSEEMLSRARSLVAVSRSRLEGGGHVTPEFVQGDIRTVRVEKQFDVAVSLFHVVSYQVTNEDLLAAFQTARVHVRKDGIFIFDVWYGPAVLTDRPVVRIKRVEDEQNVGTRLAEPVLRADRNMVDVNYHVFIRSKQTGAVHEVRERHEMRYLFVPEVEYLLGQAGFKLLHGEEWMTGRPAGVDTWGVCFVAGAV